MNRIACGCIFALAACAAYGGTDGAVDTTFHAPAGYTLATGSNPAQTDVPSVVDVLSQPDGKVVIVGNTAFAYAGQNGTEYTNAILVQRLLPDGSMDTAFGTAGKVQMVPINRLGAATIQANSAALDPDGRIAVAGFRSDVDNDDIPSQSMQVWVLNPNGTVDTSFGSDGSQNFYRGNNWSLDKAHGIYAFTAKDHQAGLRSDIGFMIVGELSDDISPTDDVSNPGPRRGIEWIIGQDGTFKLADETANLFICQETPLNDVDARVDASSGQLVVYAVGDLICGYHYAYVNRLLVDGATGNLYWDNNFGTNARSYFAYAADISMSLGKSVSIDANSRPVIAGNAYLDAGWHAIGVARLTTTGQFDTSFKGDGTLDVRFTNSPETDPSRVNVDGVLIQQDGKIIVGGDVERKSRPSVQFAMRLNANGSGDNSFTPPNPLTYSYYVPALGVNLTANVPGAGFYNSPTEATLAQNAFKSSAMSFTQGERLLLAGSVPAPFVPGDKAVVYRIDNDGIFSDGFGW